ncbi:MULTISPECIES: LexA family transcriptional regulator [unclassified Snodgrassella]|uniref:XRE family transcriptional regulator n=1 Tax=unclassified Snodgrassella TaxID=2625236 RepID=UPI0018DC08A6|nr:MULTISPECIES: LexA family transcriptional regulator [unclassified Snodgrassella]MBI0098339.1 LexA family transcriptional regulator [Snodgrassella sp. W8134]MBI0102130.1 LexA family transcriptional regulator [Snodgrassella sp. W8135]
MNKKMHETAARLYKVVAKNNNIHKQSELAHVLGVVQQSIVNWEKRGISKQGLLLIQKKLKINPDWLVSGVGNELIIDNPNDGINNQSNIELYGDFFLYDENSLFSGHYVLIPLYHDTYALDAKTGIYRYQFNQSDFKLPCSKELLKKFGVQKENVVCITVAGSSMEPVLKDGSIVAIDTSSKIIKDGRIYAIKQGSLVRIRKLYRIASDVLKISCYNQEDKVYADELVKIDKIEIIGVAFWWSVVQSI